MKFQRQRREDISINLTPLIDVVFLLLIFFMITTTFTRESHLSISLPEAAQTNTPQDEPEVIEVLIGADGQYSINDAPLVNTEPLTLKRGILKVVGETRDIPFIITADAKAEHQAVVRVMDVAGELGFSALSITTQQAESP